MTDTTEASDGTDAAGGASSGHPGMPRGLVVVFAVACGLAVANLYYAQPVLYDITRSFGTNEAEAGLVVTLSQIGYALGLALLVPLGDILTRRRFLPAVLSATAVGLVVSAAAPSIGVLVAVALVVGVGSTVAQMLVPMAASLADDARRGRVVGQVMSGLLLGILLARTVSGFVAAVTSWRAVYVLAAGVTVLMALVLRRVLPAESERPSIRYGALLRSTVALFRAEPLLRRRILFGALGMAAFSAFWTTMAFVLSGAPYHYGTASIGLFGLVGAAGALCANFAGRWADRGLTRTTTVVFAVLMGASFLPLWLGGHDLAMMIVGVLVLDVGVQGLQVTNQSMIYRLAPEARSRINSAYMVCYFAGGAVGSATASWLYGSHRWAGVCLLGAGIGVAAVALAVADALGHRARPARAAPVVAA
ncbi:MAG TPA: MFS transporter [Acidimicrobiales bacterium]|nr:MFS transporter [Acidimicrobiales bacterium]